MNNYSTFFDELVKTNSKDPDRIYYSESIEHEANLAKVERLMTSDPEAELLDAGCGIGNFVIPFAKKCKFVYGTDVSEVSIEFCKERLRNEKIENAMVWAGSVKVIPLGDNTVDKILCFSVFQYLSIDETITVIREFKRILRKDGIIVLGFLNGNSPHGLSTRLFRFARQLIKGKKVYPSTNISYPVLKKIIADEQGSTTLHHAAYFYPVLFPKKLINWLSKRYYYEKHFPKFIQKYGKSLMITVTFK
jgi:ubiquinone/menaquinone biosynthesis C-methylase UbiE